jgi:hypothetical protein
LGLQEVGRSLIRGQTFSRGSKISFLLSSNFGVRLIGGSHDQADAEWIVIRTQLRGHNECPLGGQPPAGPSAARGLTALRAYFVCFSYY